jgi:hypothetical protein
VRKTVGKLLGVVACWGIESWPRTGEGEEKDKRISKVVLVMKGKNV